VVRHAGAKRASEAVATVAEVRILEAKLKLSMGGSATPGERHTVGRGGCWLHRRWRGPA
jgi:hypothetical protein